MAVSWTEEGPPLALVQSRDQRDVQVLAIDPDTGATEVVWADHDDRWTHITPGVPAWLPGGRLLTVGHRDDTRTLLIDGEPASPAGPAGRLGARGGRRRVVPRDPRAHRDARVEARRRRLGRSQVSEVEGQHAAVAAGDLAVLVSRDGRRAVAHGSARARRRDVHTFDLVAETPVIVATPTFLSAGPKELRTAMFTPDGREPAEPLPVLLDPYGGPHWGRVVRAQRPLLESQWLADQGFVVLVIDGRGTPFRGVAWDQAVYAAGTSTPRSRIRSRACTPRPSGTRSSTCHGWRCGGGPTGGT